MQKECCRGRALGPSALNSKVVVGALREMPGRWMRRSGFVVGWELHHADTLLPGRSTRTGYLVQQGRGPGPARDALAIDMGDVGMWGCGGCWEVGVECSGVLFGMAAVSSDSKTFLERVNSDC